MWQKQVPLHFLRGVAFQDTYHIEHNIKHLFFTYSSDSRRAPSLLGERLRFDNWQHHRSPYVESWPRNESEVSWTWSTLTDLFFLDPAIHSVSEHDFAGHLYSGRDWLTSGQTKLHVSLAIGGHVWATQPITMSDNVVSLTLHAVNSHPTRLYKSRDPAQEEINVNLTVRIMTFVAMNRNYDRFAAGRSQSTRTESMLIIVSRWTQHAAQGCGNTWRPRHSTTWHTGSDNSMLLNNVSAW